MRATFGIASLGLAALALAAFAPAAQADAIAGTLDESDAQFGADDRRYYDSYKFFLEAGELYHIRLQSDDFRPWAVVLIDVPISRYPTNVFFWDIQVADSMMSHFLCVTRSGWYEIRASSTQPAGQTGEYKLAVTRLGTYTGYDQRLEIPFEASRPGTFTLGVASSQAGVMGEYPLIIQPMAEIAVERGGQSEPEAGRATVMKPAR